jgi:hypothetical protein
LLFVISSTLFVDEPQVVICAAVCEHIDRRKGVL